MNPSIFCVVFIQVLVMSAAMLVAQQPKTFTDELPPKPISKAETAKAGLIEFSNSLNEFTAVMGTRLRKMAKESEESFSTMKKLDDDIQRLQKILKVARTDMVKVGGKKVNKAQLQSLLGQTQKKEMRLTRKRVPAKEWLTQSNLGSPL